MNITPRQHAILCVIRTKRSSAGALARRFGVRSRTIYRDIAALRTRGYQLRTTRGPGGGFALADRCRPLATALSTDTIRELALSISLLASQQQLPVTQRAEELLNQLLESLPGRQEHQIRALCKQLTAKDTPQDGEASEASNPTTRPPRDLLPDVQRALLERRRVFVNVGGSHRRRFIALDPQSLEATSSGWTLNGRDHAGRQHALPLRTIWRFQVTRLRIPDRLFSGPFWTLSA